MYWYVQVYLLKEFKHILPADLLFLHHMIHLQWFQKVSLQAKSFQLFSSTLLERESTSEN